LEYNWVAKVSLNGISKCNGQIPCLIPSTNFFVLIFLVTKSKFQSYNLQQNNVDHYHIFVKHFGIFHNWNVDKTLFKRQNFDLLSLILLVRLCMWILNNGSWLILLSHGHYTSMLFFNKCINMNVFSMLTIEFCIQFWRLAKEQGSK
jgi:hypothetical protein